MQRARNFFRNVQYGQPYITSSIPAQRLDDSAIENEFGSSRSVDSSVYNDFDDDVQLDKKPKKLLYATIGSIIFSLFLIFLYWAVYNNQKSNKIHLAREQGNKLFHDFIISFEKLEFFLKFWIV